MSVRDSASALTNLLINIGLAKFKADALRQMKLNSLEMFNNSLYMLWSFIICVQRFRTDQDKQSPTDVEEAMMIKFVNDYLISQSSSLYISTHNGKNTSLNLIILLWCLTNSKISLLPDNFFNGNAFVPLISCSAFKPRHYSVETTKQCLLNISSIISAISVKESGLNLLSKTLLKQTNTLRKKFPLSSFQRDLTLLEILFILNKEKNPKGRNLTQLKHLIDWLTKWNRDSSAFYYWMRLPSDNAIPKLESSIPLSNGAYSSQDIYKSYHALQKQRSILSRHVHDLDVMTAETSKTNHFNLRKEFKHRLDFVSDYLKAPPYQIHPMATWSMASESSKTSYRFNMKSEKQILQSLVSSLKIQAENKRDHIHSRIKEFYHDLLPNVSCFHKSV